jgi:hypothetical protein
LNCVTVLRCSHFLRVAIWEHGPAEHNKNIDKAFEFFGEALTMANDDRNRGDSDSTFSFAVRELRQARAAQTLALDPGPKKPSYKEQGSDPYNTSGSFDRTKNWTRVGKR